MPAPKSVEDRLESLGYDGAAVNLRSILAAERVLPGPYAKILRELEAGLERAPSARLFALKGKALANLGRFEEARRALERSLELDGARALTRAWLGGVHLLEGTVVQAAAELDRALARDPRCGWAYFYRSASRYVMGETGAARADLSDLLKLGANDAAADAGRAFLCLLELKDGRFKESLRRLEPVLKKYSSKGWPYVLRAAVFRAQGKRAAAIRDLDRALGSLPADWIYLERAGLHEETGNAKAALRDVESALRLSPRPEVFLRRARLYAGAGRLERAMRDFGRSLPPGAADRDARGFALELFRKLDQKGRKPEALKVLCRAALAFPDDDEILAARVRNLEDMGRLKEAEALLREGLRRAPDSQGVVALLSDFLDQPDRCGEALELLQEAGKKNAKAGVLLAQALLRRGRFDGVEAALNSALDLEPENGEAWRMRGRLRAAQGRLEDSGDAYRKALAIAPDSLQTAFALAETLLRLGRPEAVRALLRSRRRELRVAGGLESLLHRFEAALLCLDFDEAADAGEKVLDATRSFSQLNKIFRPFFRVEFDFIALSPRYKRRCLAELEGHLARRPGSPWGHYFRSLLTDMLGLGEPAPDDIRRINSLPKARYGWMRSHVGEYQLIAKRDFPAAREAFAAAARACKPGNWAAQCFLAETYLCEGDHAACRRAFAVAEKMAPAAERGEVLAWRGEVLLWSGDYARALKELDAAVARHARFAQGWRGGALVKLGRYDEALVALEPATALVPHDAEARTWRAEALYRLGRFREACAEADLADTRYGRYGGFHLYALRGLSRGALGDARGMRADFDRLPRDVVDFAAKALRLKTVSSGDAPRVFEAVLELSRGVRRGGYENSVWLNRAPSGPRNRRVQ